MSPVLDVRGLTIRFGDVRVIDDLTFTVADGESLAIIGPSGSGKTVLCSLPCHSAARAPAVHGHDASRNVVRPSISQSRSSACRYGPGSSAT
jgi:ABC-type transporter Mla maintaining outer membrane lipid asymmetry ATPase subunit MlaF